MRFETLIQRIQLLIQLGSQLLQAGTVTLVYLLRLTLDLLHCSQLFGNLLLDRINHSYLGGTSVLVNLAREVEVPELGNVLADDAGEESRIEFLHGVELHRAGIRCRWVFGGLLSTHDDRLYADVVGSLGAVTL